MSDRKLNRILSQITLLIRTIVVTITLLVTLAILIASGSLDALLLKTELAAQAPETSEVVDGIHVQTGLIDAPGLQLVVQNCTTCHSSKLISQNRMNLAGWTSTIKWMQETQNLWDLGDNEETILAYLATNYAPTEKGRRARLENIEWYELE